MLSRVDAIPFASLTVPVDGVTPAAADQLTVCPGSGLLPLSTSA
ncbi:MAG TPA: hypothetical protein VKH40_17970 [Alloacidobacterium sp.]|nr:hypothetical protein [Alloacidobacterium sp.]